MPEFAGPTKFDRLLGRIVAGPVAGPDDHDAGNDTEFNIGSKGASNGP